MSVTIRTILEDLMGTVEQIDGTVDTLKPGNPETVITGMVTAFCATQYVVERAIAMNANLLITHEGLFYSHHDPSEWLENDPVYHSKLSLIERSELAIFRYHDYWHRHQPDGIMVGLLRELEWSAYVVEQQPTATILSIPAMTVSEAAQYIKRKLGIPYVRVAGDLSQTCRHVGILVGYRGGGTMAIPLFNQHNLDLIIAGEGPEWETPEYVRDAVHQGRSKALIMLGHAESEAPGMKYLAEVLAQKYRIIPTYFIAEQPIYQLV
ncbi:transcriptional regulator [Paenibacillus sp. VTT E-133280]|uniref:Nif3-like dinuclear metal center hexameric protein n=1 Tax=unclassified Paenibacillus TaxID=185978 RepID=UPI000BC68E85|nr:Nif3-like dinuclear metal center hexameric protein [Paenibacillus sp. VTT E-133280]OZQ63946.1 transcriptional regulator [Paenibacillus sp. VTT E-133280]